MYGKRLIAVFVAFAAMALPFAAFGAPSLPALSASAHAPVVDGKIGEGEYSWQTTLSGMKLALSLSADGSTLYVATEAPTTGWIAVGLGSLKMNGAFMVLGYSASGSSEVSEQTGALFGHKPNTSTILLKRAVLENSGATTLEFSLPAADYLRNPTLKLIVAYGKQDNFSSMHQKKDSCEVTLKK